MNLDVARVIAVAVGCVAAIGSATSGTNNSAAPAEPPSTCFAGFPQGVFHGSPYVTTTAQVAFFLTSSYTFKDPSLAHEGLPGVIVADMNSGSRAVQYVVADGSAGNFSFHLNIFQDATQDHYGMNLIVTGPPTLNFGGYDPSHTQTNVQYFEFTLPAQYVSGAKLIQDAAARAAGNLANGWTCN